MMRVLLAARRDVYTGLAAGLLGTPFVIVPAVALLGVELGENVVGAIVCGSWAAAALALAEHWRRRAEAAESR
ncbi:MAG: hypothetical protein SFZ24_10210 [Planctomycetota bacterium]|nr:hypothetical protein [Planctomycetota bacterium]